MFFITGNPHGAETLDVTVTGAGITFSKSYTPAEVSNPSAPKMKCGSSLRGIQPMCL